MATVLITRPQPEADRTAAAVAALGHDVLIDPLLTVEDMDVALPPHVQAVLITSVNGVRALARQGAPPYVAPVRSGRPHRRRGARTGFQHRAVRRR
ncbi:uroporphyrinogen-III synthase [Nitrospirillum viridazoti Y2]|uniref:hypothetical protein n=1 Tax=Nitrospirillum viridazoti TaxID=3144925 RepID=UPI0002265593|nr:hypothetical protein [Nitrospirillum amazonense]EGX99558.1 uroporphyrinogen-III synthase [Nitrospirillum amazonense Y2]